MLCAGSSAYPWTRALSTKEMVTAFRLSRFINLLKKENKNEMDHNQIKRCIKESKLFTYIKKDKKKKLIPVLYLDEFMIKSFFLGLK